MKNLLLFLLLLIININCNLNWKPCPNKVLNEYRAFPNFTFLKSNIECAIINVPLLWKNNSDTRTINIMAKRLKSYQPSNRKGQFFFITGGPGLSAIGSSMETVFRLFYY